MVALVAIFTIPSLRAQTSSNQPAPAQVADAMRRTIPNPNYPVPYGPTTVEAVTEVLNRIHAYLDANTPARVINSQTRAEINRFFHA
jgi:hypothetical protein